MAQISSKQCDLCSQEDGKHFCYDCQQALCDICRKKHEKIPSLVDHKLTNLQQVDLSSFNTKSNCESHRTEFTIYCKTCLCLVCLKCVTSIHAGHEFCDIEKVVSDERQDVATTITVLKSKVKALLDLKEKIECHHLEKNKASAKKVLTEIAETFKDLAQLIEHKQQIKQTEVEDFEELERQQLESFLRNVDHVLRKYTRLCEELENLLTMKHDTTFHLCYKTLKHDVENQDSIPDEPTLNEIQPFDAREAYKEILDFINSQFEMRLCGNCIDQGQHIDQLTKESKEFKDNIQREQLRVTQLVDELKDAKSTYLAENNQLQDTITELKNQLKSLTYKNEREQLMMTELVTELKDAKSENNQLQGELKAKSQASKKAEETIAELQNDFKSLKNKNERDWLRIKDLTTELIDAKSKNNQLQYQLKSDTEVLKTESLKNKYESAPMLQKQEENELIPFPGLQKEDKKKISVCETEVSGAAVKCKKLWAKPVNLKISVHVPDGNLSYVSPIHLDAVPTLQFFILESSVLIEKVRGLVDKSFKFKFKLKDDDTTIVTFTFGAVSISKGSEYQKQVISVLSHLNHSVISKEIFSKSANFNDLICKVEKEILPNVSRLVHIYNKDDLALVIVGYKSEVEEAYNEVKKLVHTVRCSQDLKLQTESEILEYDECILFIRLGEKERILEKFTGTKVDVLPEQAKITVSGPSDQVSSCIVEVKTWPKMIKCLTKPLTQDHIELLSSTKTLVYVHEYFSKRGINCVLYTAKSDKKLKLFARSEDEAEKAFEFIQSKCIEKQLLKPQEQKMVFSQPEFDEFLTKYKEQFILKEQVDGTVTVLATKDVMVKFLELSHLLTERNLQKIKRESNLKKEDISLKESENITEKRHIGYGGTIDHLMKDKTIRDDFRRNFSNVKVLEEDGKLLLLFKGTTWEIKDTEKAVEQFFTRITSKQESIGGNMCN